MCCQLAHEIFRLSCGELFVEVDDEQVAHTEISNERDLVLRRAEQMRRLFRSQHFLRMRIERHHHWCAIRRSRVIGRC